MRTRWSLGQWLHGIGNRAVRNAVNAVSPHYTTAYEQTTAAGSATGLNGPNRVRNSATLFAEPNLSVDVNGNATYLIVCNLNLSLTAANNIQFDFAAGTATIVANTMGGSATFETIGSSNFATAASATNAIPFSVNVTALNTNVNGGTTNTWNTCFIMFTCQFAAPGTLQLEFGQGVAGATNTDITPGSFLWAIPLDHVVDGG